MSYPYQIKSFEEYEEAYKKSVEDPEKFWADIAGNFLWKKKWDKVLEWNFKEPKVEWFKGAKLNITENCIDRHLEKLGDQPAIIWEPNNPEERTRVVTYSRLHKRVCQFAQVLKNNGVKKGDRVCIYMGMVPELAYAVLGCARIGAIHSVIFGGFSAQSIADRLYDAQAEFIVTCDGAYRGGKDIPLKSIIDDALIGNKTIKRVIVYTRTRTPISMIKGRDVWWEDEMEKVEEEAPSRPSPVEKETGDTLQPRDNARQSTYSLFKELSDQHKNNPTEEEKILWEYLRANKVGYHVRRQHIIDEFIVDFVCLKKMLTIEVDGGYHNNEEQIKYDKARTDFLNSLGYSEIRFTNQEIKNNIEDVVKKIKEKLDTLPDVGKNSLQNKGSQVLPTGEDLGGAATTMDAEDPLFILYTSGSTGKPKGVVHSSAGYMVWTNYTFVNVFQYQPGDVFFCTADVGWITGHSYILYGPLSAGATSVMFEGIPTWPDAGRFWDIVDKYKVNIIYTAPTAIRSLMSYGLEPLKGKDLSSLKVLGTVGEPINEEAWHWYDENIGKGKCPIVDTWWQTETGGILISNLAGITPAKPSWATLPLPGVQPVLIAPSISPNGGGNVGEQLGENGERQTKKNYQEQDQHEEFYEDADPMLYGLLKDFAKEHRSNSTDAEKFLWEQLKGKKLKDYKFRRQHIIGSFITDFICLEKKLVIEIDGLIHQLPDNILSDEERTKWLQDQDYKVIRFTNEEVINDIENVLLKIEQQLSALPNAERKIYSSSSSQQSFSKEKEHTSTSSQKSSPFPPPLGEIEGAGALCIAFPWPGILRTTYGDHERCRTNYFATYPDLYFTGDGALKDKDGNYRITGRIDDVLNVSGHRIGTAEVENAINMHAGVIESAVVGFPHEIKGQGIYAFVIVDNKPEDEEQMRKNIFQTVSRIIGPIAKPDKIQFVTGLPKTRSGKIMRRILRKIAEGETQNLGDTTTLLDPGVVDEILRSKI